MAIALAFIWLLFSDGTKFKEKSSYFFIADSSTNKGLVLTDFKQRGLVKYPFILELYTNLTGSWDHLKPGKYEIKKGQSIWRIARTISNGRIAEIKLVVNRIRTKEDLAKLISKNFSPDSVQVMNFLNSQDSITEWTLAMFLH